LENEEDKIHARKALQKQKISQSKVMFSKKGK